MSETQLWSAILRRFWKLFGRRRESVEASMKRYTLNELLAECDPNISLSQEDRAWLDLPPAGRELL
jgi:hypothetical protein